MIHLVKSKSDTRTVAFAFMATKHLQTVEWYRHWLEKELLWSLFFYPICQQQNLNYFCDCGNVPTRVHTTTKVTYKSEIASISSVTSMIFIKETATYIVPCCYRTITIPQGKVLNLKESPYNNQMITTRQKTWIAFVSITHHPRNSNIHWTLLYKTPFLTATS